MIRSRAMVVTRPGHIEMREYDLPEIGRDDGLIQVELVGVCGSDPGIFRGKVSRAPRPYPLILGHEIVGRVHRMGSEARKRFGVDEGDRVILEFAFGCGQCLPCLTGRYTLCDRMYAYGSMISCQDPPHLFGGYGDFVYVHPRANVHWLGEEVSPEAGVLIGAVLGNGVRWLSRIGGVALGRTVAVIGPGQQGLAATVVAKESGAGPIVVVGKKQDSSRLAMALRLGADLTVNSDEEDPREVLDRLTEGRMADLVMDVTGHPSGAQTALALAGLGATVVLPGLYGRQTKVPLELDQVVVRELRLLGAYSQDFESVEAAITLARQKKYPLEEMISHRLPIERAEEALRLVGGDDPDQAPIKVVLDPRL